MGYRWYEEAERNPKVKQASDLAKKARECYDKVGKKGFVAEDELNKAIDYIRQIDRIFDCESEEYCASFFSYYSIDDVGLNIAVYYTAACVALGQKRYDEADNYATRGYVLASRAQRRDDTDYIKHFDALKQRIRDTKWKESPAGLAAAKEKSLNETLDKSGYVAGFGFIIFLILTSIIGIYCGIKMIDASIILCVLYCITGMMLGYWVSFEHITGGFFVDRLVPYLFFGGSIIVVMLLQFLRVKPNYSDSVQIGLMVAPIIFKVVFNIIGLVAGLKYNKYNKSH